MIYLLVFGVIAEASKAPIHEIHVSRALQTGPPVPIPDWQGIRIKFLFQNESSAFYSSILDDFLPLAASWYEKVLNVINYGTLSISSTTCSGLEVPPGLLNSTINADMLILVTYSVSLEEGTWGQPCEINEDIGMRPVMGRIHFQGDYSNFTYEQKLSLCIHQIAHILAYDSQLLPYFLSDLGERLGISEVLGYTTRRNTQIAFIKTPKVVKAVRNAFQCNNLYGLDLESSFSEHSTSLHWEKRIMNNDFMAVNIDIYYVSYSEISLSLFEDSGWYLVNYTYANDIMWGYHKGCEFLLSPCVISGAYQFEEFCNASTSITKCDYTHTYKGVCNLGLQSLPIPQQYQYFYNSYLGGSDYFADYCPYVSPSPDGSCQDIGESSPKINKDDYGEETCDECRCLEGTYVSQFSTLNVHQHAGCHMITCEGNVAVVHIGNEVVFCDPKGGDVTIRGYDGYITCPSSDILCKILPCPFACHGRGKCLNGVCDCENGAYGTYCENNSVLLYISLIILSLF